MSVRRTRLGGFPPIVTVILFLVILGVGVLVGWWFWTVHSHAISRPVLSLSGGVYIAGGTAYFTLRNDGTVGFTGDVCIASAYGQDCVSAISIPSGSARSVNITLTNINIPAGVSSFEVIIRATGAGEIKAVAEVLRG